MARNNLIQFRKGTLSQFNSTNPTLASGEPGFAIDANVLKVGDGITPWSGLLGFSVGSGISALNGLTSSSLVIEGGHNIQVTTSGTEVISVAYTGLDHIDVSTISDETNSNNTFIQNLLFDQYGHVTGVDSVAVTGIGGSVPANVLVSGSNISLLLNDIGYDTVPKYILGASGSSHYLFSGPGLSASTADPTLYLVRGRTYKFVNNMGAHPFQFQTSAGIGGTAYTSGMDNSPISNATMTWEIRHDTPNTLYYQCTSHSSMQGTVYVLDRDSHPDISAVSNSNNNGDFFIQNLLFDQYGHVTGVLSSESATGIIDSALNTQIQSGDNIVLVYDSGTGVDPTGTLTINVTGVVELGDNISLLTNDAGYATTGELVSVSGYLQGRIDSIPSDTNTFVSGIVYNTGLRDLVLTRNDGVQLTGNFDIVLHSGDNISLLTNDSAYDSIPEYTLTSPGLGSANYRFNGPGLSGGADDPTLYLYRGKTYKFVNNMGAHPFQFQTTAGLGGTAYTDGITGSPVSNGTLTWEIEHDTPNILYYQCTSHSNMQGVVYVLDKDSHVSVATVSSVDNSNNTFIQDLLFDQYGHVTGVASVAVTGIDSVPSNVLVSGSNISLLTNDVPYITGFNETDPIFTSSVAYNITAIQTGQWGEAYSWEDHSLAGYATTGELISVSGHLQSQIDSIPPDTNTFVNNIVYNTGNREIVLSRNDGIGLTGDLSVVVQSGDNISLLNNNLGYITGFTETISSGDPISFLVNDVPYAISGTHIAITNAASNVNNTDDDFVQDLLFDEFGHITGVVSAKASSGVVNSALNTQVQAGEHILLIYDSGTGTDPTGILTINVTGIIGGGATANYLPVFSNTVTPLVNSIIHQNGDRIGIGTTNPATAIHIVAPSGNEGTVLSRTLDHTSFAGHLIRDIDDRNVASFQYCNSGVAATGLRNHVLIGSRESGIPVKFYQGRDSGQTAFKENNERIIFDIYGNTILTAASGQNVMVSGSLGVSGIITATSGNSTQWNSAYGWGDHSQAAYLTGHPVISAANTSANSGNIFIQNLTLDSNGHITAIDVAIPTGVGGGGSGISSLLEDQNPQLGGNLSLNNKNINGAGNIDIDGDITAEELTISSTDPYIYQRSTDSTETVKTYHYDTGSQLGGLLSYGKSSSQFTSFNTLLGLGAGSFHLFSSYGHLGINTYGVAKDIVFGTDNTERARITSVGDIGIGTNSPQYKLHVHGTTYIQSGIISPTAAFRTADIPLSGPPIYDGFIAYQNSDCWGLGNNANDGFVFEKTDGNQNNPDGGMFFNVRGSGGISSTAMSINGSKEIFIGQTGTYIPQGYSLNLKGSATLDSVNINGQYTFPTGDGLTGHSLVTDGAGNIIFSGVAGINGVVEDTTPKLGGNLDLNNYDIVGTGNITIVGDVEANQFIGNLRGAIYFTAKAGEALTKGDVVYISGISGNKTVVSKADANDSSKMPAFGIAAETVNHNANVNIITFGSLYNIDTDTPDWDEGDELYVSNTAGTLSKTAPTGESSQIQKIAKVTRRDNSAGSIKVMGAGRTNATPNLNEGRLFVGNSGNQTVADGTIHVDIANSRVGIGTASPSEKLHVVGNVFVDRSSTTTSKIDFKAFSAGFSTNATDLDYIRLYSASAAHAGMGITASNFNIGTSGAINTSIYTNNNLMVRYATSNITRHYCDQFFNTECYFVQGGSSTSPTLSVEGDSDTGFYFPSANTICASTAGLERIRINSAGNVGIGTNSPVSKLDIRDGDILVGTKLVVGSGVYSQTSPGAYFGLKHTSLTGPSEYMIMSAGTHTYLSAKEDSNVYIRGGGNKFDHQIMVNESGITLGKYRPAASSVVAEHDVELVYDDGGCVRIADRGGSGVMIGDCALSGNTAFAGIKHTSMAGGNDYMMVSALGNTFISASSGNTVFIRGGGNAAESEIRVLDVGAGGVGIVFNEAGSDRDIRMEGTGNANLFRLDASTDRIGIGTATPAYKLDVAGTFSADSVNVNNQYTLPTADGSAGQSLVTDGAGNIVFSDIAGGAGGSGNLVRGSEVVTATTGLFDVSEGYSVGTLDVYQNGVKLFEGASYDYTATNGTSFSLNNPATSGDLIEYIALNTSTNAVGNTSLGTITVTSPQDVFNTVDTFTSSNLAVFLNGVKLIDGEDYDVTSTSQFTLDSVATSGDIVEYIAYGATVASSNLQKTGDTMTGNLTVNADLIVKGYKETHTDNGNTGTAQTIDISDSTLQTYTLTGNCTFTMPTADAGRSFTMFLKTGAGSFTSTFTGVKFPSNVAPTITTDANRMDILTFYSDGTNWYGSIQQEYHV
jgi:hypothetical protein